MNVITRPSLHRLTQMGDALRVGDLHVFRAIRISLDVPTLSFSGQGNRNYRIVEPLLLSLYRLPRFKTAVFERTGLRLSHLKG